MSDWIDEERDRRAKGETRPLTQSQHAQVNGRYPGCTLEMCDQCGTPTGRAGDDSLFCGDAGPLCPPCYEAAVHE